MDTKHESSKVKQQQQEDRLIANILAKYIEVKDKYAPHPTVQHSLFVLREEVNELFEEARQKDWSWNYKNMYKETIDIIVSCMRLLLEEKKFESLINGDWEIK